MSDYRTKLEAFRQIVERHHNERLERLYPNLDPEVFEIEQGYKFDKVYLVTGSQRIGRYMVETRTENIYGIKSWTQVNKRRLWGRLDQIEQWDWSTIEPTPRPGTDAECELIEFEENIKSNYKQRGRPPKNRS